MTAEALAVAYGELVDVVASLDDGDGWRPTGCVGWAVRDLTFHLLGDAQRALVAFATPAGRPADTDAVSYWAPDEWGDDGAANGRRFTRVAASMWTTFPPLRDLHVETARAAVRAAARVPADEVVTTQGLALTVADLCTTLAVEAAVHQLDLVVALDRPGPRALAPVRETLDGLLGRPVPLPWSDDHYARAGTGRVPLTDDERAALGADAARFPLFR